MNTFIYTIRGARSENDAKQFLLDIILTEYSQYDADDVMLKGFRRTFAQTDDEIDIRLNKMHKHSPTEYSWGGIDKKHGKLYIFWGYTASEPQQTGSHNVL